MAKETSRNRLNTAEASAIRFTATLHRPAVKGMADTELTRTKARNGGGNAQGHETVTWTFLNLPAEASAMLPTRSMQSVTGTFNGTPFAATLEPDGRGGHWLRVEEKLRRKAGAEAGDVVTLEIAPVSVEPEPMVPGDVKKALAASPKALETWADITAIARRDWIFWMVSGKKAETRVKRIATACDMLAKGKRRACCFDRSGMYDKSLSCPVAEDGAPPSRQQARVKRR